MLELKNVTKAYNKGSVKAVDNLTMTVNDGEIFGFLGIFEKAINKLLVIRSKQK